MRRLSVAILMFMAAQSAVAQEVFFAYGRGVQKYCSDFTAATEGLKLGRSLKWEDRSDGRIFFDESTNFLDWAFGYISAYNSSAQHRGTAQVRGSLVTRLDAELRAYCAKNPSAAFVTAVENFIEVQIGK